jgi:uncharacterized membrane protein
MGAVHTVEVVEREPVHVAPTPAPTEPEPRAAPPSASAAPPEQVLYAKVLAAGMYTGLGTLLATFALYLTGAVKPAVPIDRLPDLWSLDVTEYLQTVNAEYLHRDHVLTGWSWVSVLGHGDYLNFVGIVVLSLVTVACFLRIIPTLYGKRDHIYAAIAVLEVVILVLAASGVLAVGE